MRMQYRVYPARTINNLLSAAQGLIDVIHSGEVFADDPDKQKKAVDAADILESCIAVAQGVIKAGPVGNESPFTFYRDEILGYYSTAHRLQDLALHLWNSGNPCRLADLFGNADEKHTRIALEMITAYTFRGENDQAFMNLADEIRDRRAEQKRRAAETADA